MATTGRLALRTTETQTYTEQQSDPHRPVEARLRKTVSAITHLAYSTNPKHARSNRAPARRTCTHWQ
jgi:hypothetical protein